MKLIIQYPFTYIALFTLLTIIETEPKLGPCWIFILAPQACKWELENNQQLEKMHPVWIEKSLASSPEKDFLLSVIMGINDSPMKWCVLLIAHVLSKLGWSSRAELAGIQITAMVAKTKLQWKRKFEVLRKLNVNLLNRNKEGAYSLKYVCLCSYFISMPNFLKMINGGGEGDLVKANLHSLTLPCLGKVLNPYVCWERRLWEQTPQGQELLLTFWLSFNK